MPRMQRNHIPYKTEKIRFLQLVMDNSRMFLNKGVCKTDWAQKKGQHAIQQIPRTKH